MADHGGDPLRADRVSSARTAVAEAVRRGGSALRRASAPALVGLLVAGAAVPVAAAGTVTGPMLLAGAGVLGSVGANVLTEVLTRLTDRLRPDGGPPDPVRLQQALAERIEAAFASQDEESRQLRTEAAELLGRVGAIEVALRTAIELGDRELQHTLAVSLSRLSGEFGEFGFVLAAVRDSMWQIEQELRGIREHGRAEQERSRELALSVRRILDTVERVEARTRDAGASDTGPAARWSGNPYLGLSPFDERHAEVFYGRRELVARLLQRLGEQLEVGGPLLVIGASGAGKSSLLRAGLLPQLAAGRLVAGSAAWPRRVFTPTASPLRELALHLADLAGLDAGSVLVSLRDDPDRAALIATQALRAVGVDQGRLVLVVDQFEELFTLAAAGPEPDRRAFVQALEAMARPAPDSTQASALVVLAVRADFLDPLMTLAGLREAVQQGPFTVGPMSESELTAAIAGPAAEAGVLVAPELLEAVLHDLRGAGGFDVGVLPLLSEAMRVTWEHREGDRLTVLGYRRAGGVSGAVQTSAEAVYGRLDEDLRATARSVFTCLTVPTRDGRLVRRRMDRADLHRLCGETDRVDRVVDAFTGQRLLIAADQGIEISHDALLATWSRLRTWLESDRADRTRQHELLAAADAWEQHDRNASYLYVGDQLITVVRAVARWQADPERHPALTATATEFLDRSLRAQQRSRRARQVTVGALVLLLLASLTAAGLAVRGQREARQQQRAATAGALLDQAEKLRDNAPQLALMLALAADRLHHDRSSTASLVASLLAPYAGTLTGHRGAVTALSFRPDGRLLATSGADGRVLLWDPESMRKIGEFDGTPRVDAVTFSPDGRTLAAGNGNGTIALWDVADPAEPRRIATATGQPAVVSSVAYSPDGGRLAVGDSGGGLTLWEVTDPTRPRRAADLSGHSGWWVSAVAFSPDGRTLVSGDLGGQAFVWDAVRARRVGQLTGHRDGVGAFGFGPDGRRLASGGGDGILLWDLTDPARPKRIGELTGPTGSVRALRVSGPDGQYVIGVGADRSVRRWDVTDPARQIRTTLVSATRTTWVNAVAVSPDGQTVATASADSTVVLWRGGAGAGLSVQYRLGGHDGEVHAVRFRSDGRLLATGGADGRTNLWDLAEGVQPRRRGPLAAHPGGVHAVDFSPDGRILATGGQDGAALWDLVTDAAREVARLPGHPGPVTSVAFRPDRDTGRLLAVGGGDGMTALWDVTDPAAARRLGAFGGHLAGVSTVAFSPDGETLAVGSFDGTATLWAVGDPSQPRQLSRLTSHTNQVTTLAFAPTGDTLATGSLDTSVMLWDVRDPTRPTVIGAPLPNHTSWVRALAFSPDGRHLATGSNDQSTALVEVSDPARPQGLIGARSQRAVILGVAFSPDSRTLATGGADNLVYLWSLAEVAEAQADPVTQACTRAGRGLDHREWARHVPNLPYEQTCP
ncbi:hypothetical protein ACGFIK_24075 [Micromonospora sp. NPDC048871]|uniref:nSTAND1 domain-containing NTPase n=1 Tax=Micromonospora sp. NPDC048871 TaxID=3364259 RepID=UPI00371AF825